MVQRVSTVAFEGIEARAVDVQVQVAPGLPAFAIVGLPDKAVSEARERVRSALIASGLALPARRITVNLAPADLPKRYRDPAANFATRWMLHAGRHRHVNDGAKIHESVFERIALVQTYRPPNLPAQFERVL